MHQRVRNQIATSHGEKIKNYEAILSGSIRSSSLDVSVTLPTTLKFMTGEISLTITIFSHVINFEFLHKFPRSVFYARIDEGLPGSSKIKLNSSTTTLREILTTY